MRGVALVALFLVLSVGCSASNRDDSNHRVSLQIKLVEYTQGVLPAKQHTRSFSLVCGPPGGTLPLAARVCRDIRLHPRAMLRPPRRHSVCLGSPWSPELTVVAYAAGNKTTLSGIPFCDWPGGTALGLYWGAARTDERTVALAEPRLRCDEDPVLLGSPTPFASVAACVYGHWTPRTERLIQIVERSRAIARLRPRRLFPHDIGALPCTIPVGGPVTGRTLAGQCGVYVKHVWASPAVTLVEAWPRENNGVHRHVWRFVVRHGHALLVDESGPTLPQDAE
jgi:hypothetical protein